MTARRAVLIFNPKSGRQAAARLIPRLQQVLERAGFAVTPTPTAHAGDATRLAAQAVAEGRAEVVFAMGGDGTLREVAALMKRLGAWRAVNLDGGGSSTLVVEKDGAAQVMNAPYHTRIPMRERPVANHLGVYAEPLAE